MTEPKSEIPLEYEEKLDAFLEMDLPDELFLKHDISPMEFCMNIAKNEHDGKVLKKFKTVVELCGGSLKFNMSAGGSHVIKLTHSKCVIFNSNEEIFLSTYLLDCVQEKRLLNLNSYRVSKKNSSNAMNILKGLISWEDAMKEKCPSSGEEVSDFSDNEENPSLHVSSSKTKSAKSMKKTYTLMEEKKILSYIIENHYYNRVKGNSLWLRMEELKVCDNRTWQSMRGRYLNHIIRRIEVFHLDPVTQAKTLLPFSENIGNDSFESVSTAHNIKFSTRINYPPVIKKGIEDVSAGEDVANNIHVDCLERKEEVTVGVLKNQEDVFVAVADESQARSCEEANKSKNYVNLESDPKAVTIDHFVNEASNAITNENEINIDGSEGNSTEYVSETELDASNSSVLKASMQSSPSLLDRRSVELPTVVAECNSDYDDADSRETIIFKYDQEASTKLPADQTGTDIEGSSKEKRDSLIENSSDEEILLQHYGRRSSTPRLLLESDQESEKGETTSRRSKRNQREKLTGAVKGSSPVLDHEINGVETRIRRNNASTSAQRPNTEFEWPETESGLDGNASDWEESKTKKTQNRTLKSYNEVDDLAILKYIYKHNAFMKVKGKSLWDCMVERGVVQGRSWLGLKERFTKRIFPRLDSYTKLSKNIIEKFKTEIPISNRVKEEPCRYMIKYTAYEDECILKFIIRNKRYKEIKGKSMWVSMAKNKEFRIRTWESLKNRFLQNIAPKINQFELTEEERTNFVWALEGKSKGKSKFKTPPPFVRANKSASGIDVSNDTLESSSHLEEDTLQSKEDTLVLVGPEEKLSSEKEDLQTTGRRSKKRESPFELETTKIKRRLLKRYDRCDPLYEKTPQVSILEKKRKKVFPHPQCTVESNYNNTSAQAKLEAVAAEGIQYEIPREDVNIDQCVLEEDVNPETSMEKENLTPNESKKPDKSLNDGNISIKDSERRKSLRNRSINFSPKKSPSKKKISPEKLRCELGPKSKCITAEKSIRLTHSPRKSLRAEQTSKERDNLDSNLIVTPETNLSPRPYSLRDKMTNESPVKKVQSLAATKPFTRTITRLTTNRKRRKLNRNEKKAEEKP